jgi:ribosomal protein S18 acetylase RimI-like enzyme
MPNTSCEYKVKSATMQDIFLHLMNCDQNFIPPLSQKVDLNEYAKKLNDKSITFEAWSENMLVGLVAAYMNNEHEQTAYVSSVSLMKEYTGKGIASELMKMCHQYAEQHNFRIIKLEVNISNIPAISLYKKIGYIETEMKGERQIMKYEINKNDG